MSIRAGVASALFGALLLAGCGGNATPKPDRDIPSAAFPAAHRPVAPIVSSRWSTEEARDRLKEADRVMDLAGVKPGMTVADIGAGEGYYTIRLAQRVGQRKQFVVRQLSVCRLMRTQPRLDDLPHCRNGGSEELQVALQVRALAGRSLRCANRRKLLMQQLGCCLRVQIRATSRHASATMRETARQSGRR